MDQNTEPIDSHSSPAMDTDSATSHGRLPMQSEHHEPSISMPIDKSIMAALPTTPLPPKPFRFETPREQQVVRPIKKVLEKDKMQYTYRQLIEAEPVGVRPLFVQHCYLSELPGSLFPDWLDCSQFQNVLDVGCRAGDWILALAKRYPKTEFFGVDPSEYYIGQAQGQTEHLPNARFLRKNVDEIIQTTKGVRRFNLIHVSFCIGEFRVEALYALLEALLKLLKPGGYLIWTETDMPQSSSANCEHFSRLIARTLQMSHSAFGPGDTLGIVPRMGPWLRHLGCRIVQDSARVIDVCRDVEARRNFMHHFHVFSHQMKPHVLAKGLTWEKAYEGLCEDVRRDMLDPSFCAICLMRTLIVAPPANGQEREKGIVGKTNVGLEPLQRQ
jgi:ubiquinone/menaquinone biosynthesis C-methylase UbiE